jgi:hypothetical protein
LNFFFFEKLTTREIEIFKVNDLEDRREMRGKGGRERRRCERGGRSLVKKTNNVRK